MNKKLEQINKKIEILKDQKDQIETKMARNKNSKYVGKCYKYRNSYSVGEAWWLYLRITKADDGLDGYHFEHTSMDFFEIVRFKYWNIGDSYEEITRKEFDDAWANFQAELASFMKNQ